MFWKKNKQLKQGTLSQSWVLKGFQDSLDGFYIIQGEQFFASQKLIDLIGGESDDPNLRSISWWIAQIHPDDLEWYQNYVVDRCAGISHQKQIECRIRHRAGHWVYLLINSYVYEEEGGKKSSFLGTVVDVSSYRILCDQLERIIEEGEKSSQAKSQFIASLNHELRTPLNGIIGMSQLLKESSLTKQQDAYIGNIAASAQLLLNLVNDILDVSKITAGKLDIENVNFNLKGILKNTISLLEPVATLKGLKFILKIEDNVPEWVCGDQVRLQQIIVNLLTNAIKFTAKGKVTLSVQLRFQDSEMREDHSLKPSLFHILFKVTDTGCGIPATVLPKLFQDFTQANASVGRTHGGTGLGLSICRKLVSLMHGEIGVQSTIDRGSTFWFVLPYSLGKEEEIIERKNIPVTSLASTQILVAEDNLINQKVIEGLINSLGGQVIIAHNGQDAIDLMEKCNHDQDLKLNTSYFDLIFMDINMPKVDGHKAMAAIRQMKFGKNIPIIACTADIISYKREDFIDEGFTDVIRKPITKQHLSEIFEKYLVVDNSQTKDEIIQDEEPFDIESDQDLDILRDQDSSRNDLNLINSSFLSDLKDDLGEETVNRLVDLYKCDARQLLVDLQEKYNSGSRNAENQKEIHNLAHTLAGMSENLGLVGVGETARSVMSMTIGKDSSLNLPPVELINELVGKFQETIRQIES